MHRYRAIRSVLSSVRSSILPLVLPLSLLSAASGVSLAGDTDVAAALPAPAHQIEFDPFRERVYISSPQSNQVFIFDTKTYELVDRVQIGPFPHGIELSIDGTKLYIALRSGGAVAELDLDSFEQRSIPVAAAMGSALTFDVAQPVPGRLFVSANPGSGGSASVVCVYLDEDDRIEPVMSARCNPTFESDRERGLLYVGECFSPNSLSKIDASATPPVRVLEDQHGTVSGTDRVAVSPDGSRIVLGSGQVLDAETFASTRSLAFGTPLFFDNPDEVAIAQGASQPVFNVFNIDSGGHIATLPIPCEDGGGIFEVLDLGDGRGYLGITQNELCGVDLDLGCEGSPGAPDAVSPLNGEIGIEADAALDWSSGANGCPTSYGVFFGLSGGALAPIAEDLSSTSLAVDGLEYDTTYAWQVVATNASGTTLSDVFEFTTSRCPPPGVQVGRLDLPGFAHDMEFVEEISRVFVSIPASNEVLVVATPAMEVIDRIAFDAQPYGIEVSHDRSKLYAALRGAGAIGVYDLTTGEQSEIDIGATLGSPLVYDLIEATPGDLFVSANPGSGGTSRIVRLDPSDPSSQRVVAGGRTIRCGPNFAADDAGEYLYVGACFSPNSLYKLDLSNPDAPIVGEDDHGTVSGTSRLVVEPGGERVYLRFGQVIDTDTMYPNGTVPTGGTAAFAFLHGDPSVVYSVTDHGILESFSTSTFVRTDSEELPGGVVGTPIQLAFDASGELAVYLSSDQLMVIQRPLIEDCNGNGLPDSCEIDLGEASDRNGDGIPDECQCREAEDDGCLLLCVDELRCTPTGSMPYELSASVTNRSDRPARYALIVGPDGAVVEPEVVVLDEPALPGRVAALPEIAIDGIEPDEDFELGIVLLDESYEACCAGQFVFRTPVCCADADVLSTESGNGQDVSVGLRIRNLTADDIGNIFVFDPSGQFAVDPDHFTPRDAIPPLGVEELEFTVVGAAGEQSVELALTLHTDDLAFCCGQPLVVTPPAASCPGDLTLDGVLGLDDISLFITRFQDGHPDADLNEDGGLDLEDIVAFVTVYTTGC